MKRHTTHRLKQLSVLSTRLVCLLFIVVSVMPSVVGAVASADPCPEGMTALDCQAIYGTWTNWVPDDGSATCGTSAVSLTGSDNIEKAFNFFISSQGGGLTAIQAAAVVGNLVDESHLDPTIMQKGGNSKNPNDADPLGWGIAQWTPGSKITGIAHDLGVTTPIYELDSQLQIVYKEMTGTSPTGASNMMAGLKNMTNLSEAVEYFRTQFEGGIPGNRQADARDVLRLYGNNQGGDTSATVDDTCSSGDISGSGSGNFTTNTSVSYPGLETMLSNAKRAAAPNKNKPGAKTISNQAVCNSSTCYGTCMHTMAALWGYPSSGYSSPYETLGGVASMWNTLKGTSHAHAGDRNVPVGALLIYSGSPGHVVIYLGNNLIISTDTGSDGSYVGGGGIHIVSADSIEKKWGMNYGGWVDPVFGGKLGYGSVHY